MRGAVLDTEDLEPVRNGDDPCPTCGGTGEVGRTGQEGPCGTCGGTGKW